MLDLNYLQNDNSSCYMDSVLYCLLANPSIYLKDKLFNHTEDNLSNGVRTQLKTIYEYIHKEINPHSTHKYIHNHFDN